jgi:uncharacterized membrane protein YgcG
MPRLISPTLAEILPASKRREMLEIYLNNGEKLYLTRGQFPPEIPPVNYQNKIREVSELRQSIDGAIDRITIICENITSDLGFDLASNSRLLDFAFAIYGRQYVSIRDEELIETIPKVFPGIIANVDANESRIEFEFIADIESMGPILAARSLSPRCQFAYKNGIECTSTSSETNCPKNREACILRGKEWEFGGTEFFEEPIPNPPSGGDGGGIGGGDGGGYGGGGEGGGGYGGGYGRDFYNLY